jgi:predicted MFS family arabinose efflux permease
MVGGLTLANVIGVPLGSAFGQALGWRGPFWIPAGLAVVAMPVIARQVRDGGERAQLSVRPRSPRCARSAYGSCSWPPPCSKRG